MAINNDSTDQDFREPVPETASLEINPPKIGSRTLSSTKRPAIWNWLIEGVEEQLEKRYLERQRTSFLSRFSLPLFCGTAVTLFFASCFSFQSTWIYWVFASALVVCFALELWQGLLELYAFTALNLLRDETERIDQYRLVLGIDHNFWKTEVVPRGSDRIKILSQYVNRHFVLAARRIAFAHVSSFVLLWLRLLFVCCLASTAPGRVGQDPSPRATATRIRPVSPRIQDRGRPYTDERGRGLSECGHARDDRIWRLSPANFTGKIMASLQIMVGMIYLAVGLQILVTVIIETLKQDLDESKKLLIVRVFKLAEDQWNFNL